MQIARGGTPDERLPDARQLARAARSFLGAIPPREVKRPSRGAPQRPRLPANDDQALDVGVLALIVRALAHDFFEERFFGAGAPALATAAAGAAASSSWP